MLSDEQAHQLVKELFDAGHKVAALIVHERSMAMARVNAKVERGCHPACTLGYRHKGSCYDSLTGCDLPMAEDDIEQARRCG